MLESNHTTLNPCDDLRDPVLCFDPGLCWVPAWLGAGELDVPTSEGEESSEG